MKLPKIAREWLSGLLDRDAKANSLFIDDLPPVPDGVDPLYWRLSQGHINIAPNKPVKLDLRTIDDMEVRFRDGPA